LTIRPFAQEDFAFLKAMHADSEVNHFLGNSDPWSDARVQEWLDKAMLWHRRGRGQMLVVRKSDGSPIGRCGLTPFRVNKELPMPRYFWGEDRVPEGLQTVEECELGYTFHRDAWGQGYATEAAAIMRDYGFDTLNLPFLICMVHPDNVASLKVCERTGFVATGPANVAGQEIRRHQLADYR